MKNYLAIPYQVPEFVRNEHPTFVEFLKAYYKWYRQEFAANRIEDLLDIDNTAAEFVRYFRRQLDFYGITLNLDDRAYIKRLRRLYEQKGSSAGIEFLLQMVYGKGSTVSSPWESVFKPSQGEWYKTSSVVVQSLNFNEQQPVNFITGFEYKITELGTTNWNAIAGTTNTVYEVGDIVVATSDGISTQTGTTGTAILTIDNLPGNLVSFYTQPDPTNDYEYRIYDAFVTDLVELTPISENDPIRYELFVTKFPLNETLETFHVIFDGSESISGEVYNSIVSVKVESGGQDFRIGQVFIVGDTLNPILNATTPITGGGTYVKVKDTTATGAIRAAEIFQYGVDHTFVDGTFNVTFTPADAEITSANQVDTNKIEYSNCIVATTKPLASYFTGAQLTSSGQIQTDSSTDDIMFLNAAITSIDGITINPQTVFATNKVTIDGVASNPNTITIANNPFQTGTRVFYNNNNGTPIALAGGGNLTGSFYTVRISNTLIKLARTPSGQLNIPIHRFTSSNIDLVANTITINNHGLTTGDRLAYYHTSNVTGAAMAPLNKGVYCYVIVMDANTIKLASTYINAMQEEPINIISGGIGNQYISSINPVTSELTYNNHGLSTGDSITYMTGGSTTISGLTNGNQYWAIKVDDNTIKLTTSYSSAISSNPSIVVIEVPTNGNSVEYLDTTLRFADGGNNNQSIATRINDRILLKDELVSTRNGIYQVSSDNLTLSRYLMPTQFEVVDGIDPIGLHQLFDGVYPVVTGSVLTANSTITLTGHTLATGTQITYNVGSGGAIGGLTHAQPYYVIYYGPNSIRLANSKINAYNGMYITLTSTGNSTQSFYHGTSSNPVTFASTLEIAKGATVYVTSGEINAETRWMQTEFLFSSDTSLITEAPTTYNIPTYTIKMTQVNLDNDTITIPSHAYIGGDYVYYRNGGLPAPDLLSPLVSGNGYFVIYVDPNTIKLASNFQNYLNGTAINLSAQGIDTQILTAVNLTADGATVGTQNILTVNGTAAEWPLGTQIRYIAAGNNISEPIIGGLIDGRYYYAIPVATTSYTGTPPGSSTAVSIYKTRIHLATSYANAIANRYVTFTSRGTSGQVVVRKGNWSNKIIWSPINDAATLTFTQGSVRDYPGYYSVNYNVLGDAVPIQDSFYYQPFSYVTSTELPPSAYRDLVQSTMHPTGTKHFTRYEVNYEFKPDLMGFGFLKTLLSIDDIFDFAIVSDNFDHFEMKKVIQPSFDYPYYLTTGAIVNQSTVTAASTAAGYGVGTKTVAATSGTSSTSVVTSTLVNLLAAGGTVRYTFKVPLLLDLVIEQPVTLTASVSGVIKFTITGTIFTYEPDNLGVANLTINVLTATGTAGTYTSWAYSMPAQTRGTFIDQNKDQMWNTDSLRGQYVFIKSASGTGSNNGGYGGIASARRIASNTNENITLASDWVYNETDGVDTVWHTINSTTKPAGDVTYQIVDTFVSHRGPGTNAVTDWRYVNRVVDPIANVISGTNPQQPGGTNNTVIASHLDPGTNSVTDWRYVNRVVDPILNVIDGTNPPQAGGTKNAVTVTDLQMGSNSTTDWLYVRRAVDSIGTSFDLIEGTNPPKAGGTKNAVTAVDTVLTQYTPGNSQDFVIFSDYKYDSVTQQFTTTPNVALSVTINTSGDSSTIALPVDNWSNVLLDPYVGAGYMYTSYFENESAITN